MKYVVLLASFISVLVACSGPQEKGDSPRETSPIVGTWKLLSGTLIEDGDTTITNYTTNLSAIKMLNDTHFSFMQHDMKKGADTAAVYASGGGTYTLIDSTYTEQLEFCSDRQWEGNEFKFTISIKNDTLIQSGVEVVKEAGVNRLNIEKYVRLSK